MNVYAAVILAALCASPAYAQDSKGGHGSHHPAAALSDGEVRKVDKDAKKITIKHGPLANLDMPAMTMVFKIGDGVDAAKLKAGSKIEFVADRVSGKLTVVEVK